MEIISKTPVRGHNAQENVEKFRFSRRFADFSWKIARKPKIDCTVPHIRLVLWFSTKQANG